MRAVKHRALRLLVRSYQPASAIREVQLILIVALAILVWMAWAIDMYGMVFAFILPFRLPFHHCSGWTDNVDGSTEKTSAQSAFKGTYSDANDNTT